MGNNLLMNNKVVKMTVYVAAIAIMFGLLFFKDFIFGAQRWLDRELKLVNHRLGQVEDCNKDQDKELETQDKRTDIVERTYDRIDERLKNIEDVLGVKRRNPHHNDEDEVGG